MATQTGTVCLTRDSYAGKIKSSSFYPVSESVIEELCHFYVLGLQKRCNLINSIAIFNAFWIKKFNYFKIGRIITIK
jgi:hypothetical protein